MIDWKPMSEKPDRSCPCLLWVRELISGWEYEIDDYFMRAEDGYEESGFAIERTNASTLNTKREIIAWCEVDPPEWSMAVRRNGRTWRP